MVPCAKIDLGSIISLYISYKQYFPGFRNKQSDTTQKLKQNSS